MMLVSPGGQNAIVMSDAGGSGDLVACNLTLDDEAAGPAARFVDQLPRELPAG